MVHPVFDNLPTTIFERMSGLARQHGAINLGQGFPDDQGPLPVREAAARALIEGSNQYPPMRGLPELRAAVAGHYARAQDLTLDPDSEIIVTSGATEALAAAFTALISPGDEVLLFQPLYDAYLPLVRRAGGVPKLIRLAPPHWRFDRAMLGAAFSDRTRMVVLNSPLNPAAVVTPDEDLALLAEFCVKHDTIAICDEVWEAVVFDGRRHRPLINFPGMRERTVKIGSAGKLFGMTGWKVGFLMAAPAMTRPLAAAHQFLTFTTPPNLQAGVAWGLDNHRAWFDQMPAEMQRSRDRLTDGLRAAGYVVLESQGTYFLNVDLTASGIPVDDVTFCERTVVEFGVAAIPVSAFFAEDPVRNVVRLCFAKAVGTLDAAVERLSAARTAFSA
ncbi:aminotransferase [Caulobacter sp. FWC2]|uniref:aminotransferase n=1 Tax=Caulobacter sp. FWC2 TaxID=69664 RepID=UPI000C14F9F3|nr:aminotransferase [Caulobacter sp. FWC2]PIB90649.1 aminotransferase [Caulobacter sp. FWC2]